MTIDGVRDVWATAKLGKGLTLLVEKDYHAVGYVDPSNEVKLYLNPPLMKHQVITDAVEEIISTVIEKKGDVVVVENGMLEEHERTWFKSFLQFQPGSVWTKDGYLSSGSSSTPLASLVVA
jgi:signal peptidase I